MKLYLLEQNENTGYDTHDSCIVAAKTSIDAPTIHPYEFNEGKEWWLDEVNTKYGTWATHPDKVSVTYLGVADPSIERGVIIASFNAG